MTATEMIPAVGITVLVRFEDCRFRCTVKDVKHVYGRPRILIAPIDGDGSQWVELSRVTIPATDPAKPTWTQVTA